MNTDTTSRNTKFWQQPSFYLGSMVVLLLVSFSLRIHRLGDKSIWWDEGLAAWAARQSFAVATQWTANDVHPPLYFWLLQLWHFVSGDTEFGLRLLSVFVGVMTISMTYLLGQTIGGKKVGLLAALLLTFSRFNIAWSQEMRMYALSALLGAGALWATARVWKYGRRKDWLAYIFFMTAGLYTLYLSVMVLFVANLVWLMFVLPHARNKWREFITWSLAQVAVLLLFAPWLAYAIGKIPTWTSASPVALVDFVKIYWTVMVSGIASNVDDLARFTLPVLLIFLVGTAVLLYQVIKTRKQNPQPLYLLALLLFGLLLPALVVYIVSLPKTNFFYAPQIAPRYLIIFLSAYVVLLAWGVVRLGQFQRGVTLILTLVILFAAGIGLRGYHNGRVRLDDYSSMVDTIYAYAQPTDAVVLHSDKDWPIFAYHYADDWAGVPHGWDVDAETAVSYLDPIWQNNDGIWMALTPYASVTDPDNHMINWLDQQAVATLDFNHGDKALRFYARTPERATQINTLAANARPQFDTYTVVKPGFHFVGYDLPSGTYHSGDTIRLGLYFFRGEQMADDNHAMEIGLKGRDGQAIQWATVQLTPDDQSSADGLIRKEAVFQVPPDTTEGNYDFYLLNCGGDCDQFAQVWIKERFQTFVGADDVEIAYPLDITFANGIQLLGYNVEEEMITPGEPVRMSLYWHTDEPIDTQFKVFTHLLGDVFNAETENFLWGQQDNEPANNRRPTNTWRPGEVIVDAYAMPTALNAPEGTYTLEIGLYNPVTGERLMIVDDAGNVTADHAILETAVIIKNEGN